MSRPHSVSQDGGRRTSGRIFVRRQQPAKRRMSSEHWKRFDETRIDAHSFRFTLPGQVEVAADRDRDLFKPMVSCLDVEILRRGKPILGDAQARRAIPQDYQPVWAVVGQRTKQQRVCHAEDGGVRPNPNRQRQYCRHCEPWVLCERAKSESNVLHPWVHWNVMLAQPTVAAKWMSGQAAAMAAHRVYGNLKIRGRAAQAFDLTGRALLQHLHHRRRSPYLRLGDEQVNMFWHHHVSHHHKAITLARLFQNREGAVAAGRGAQKRQSPVVRGSDKVQMMSAVSPMQAAGHNKPIVRQHRTRPCKERKDGAPSVPEREK